MTTTKTDALADLCTAEQAGEVPPPDTADAGWQRLQDALWPGPPGGGDGGDPTPGDPGGAPPAAAGPGAAAAGGLPGAVKIAAGLALATATAVAIVRSSSTEAPPIEPARVAAPIGDAPRVGGASEGHPALRAAEPDPPQLAVAPATGATAIDPPPRQDVDEPAQTEAAPIEKRTAALPDVPGEGLAHEVAILREASAALAAGKPGVALRWTRRHAADHPDGSLTEERLATEAIARCQLHDRRASVTADRFLRRYPRSTHESRVRAACETMKPR